MPPRRGGVVNEGLNLRMRTKVSGVKSSNPVIGHAR